MVPRNARVITVKELASLPGSESGEALVVRCVGATPAHRERLPLPARLARGLHLAFAAGQVRWRARRAASRMRAAGLSPERLEVGRPEDGQSIGLAGGRVRFPQQALVVGSHQGRTPSVLDEAKLVAVGPEADVGRTRVLASGAVMAEVTARSVSHVLRVVGPLAGAAVSEEARILERLLSSDPPAAVRDRLAAPTASGTINPYRWWLEPRRPGSHPRDLGPELWEDCIEFLVALRAANGAGTRQAAELIAECASTVEVHLGQGDTGRVAALGERLTDLIAGLSLGWGHGDFHPGNLLAEDSRLGTVLDWDAAGPSELPLLDLLHLLATSEPALRRRTHGDRSTGGLWRLVRGGIDPRIAAYCERTATPRDSDLLGALVQAYWLTRVAGDLRRFGDRSARPEWLERNVRRPLAELT